MDTVMGTGKQNRNRHCDEQLEKMLRKLDMEQTKVLLEEEKTKLTTVTKGEEVKCDFRIEKETNKKQAQKDGKENNMNREKNNSKDGKDGNNKDSNHISEEKQELSDNNPAEDEQNAQHELVDGGIVGSVKMLSRNWVAAT